MALDSNQMIGTGARVTVELVLAIFVAALTVLGLAMIAFGIIFSVNPRDSAIAAYLIVNGSLFLIGALGTAGVALKWFERYANVKLMVVAFVAEIILLYLEYRPIYLVD